MKTKASILALALASGACCFGYEAPAWRIASDASGVTISVDVDEPLADLPGEPENELEIFFAPFPNDNRYYQFFGDLRERAVGPYYWSKGGDYARFADWKVAYDVQKGKGYCVKASLPWGDLRNCAPVTGGVWRVAVARTRQGEAFKITSGAPHEPKTWAAVAMPALDAASAAEAQRQIAAAKEHPKEVKLRVWAKPGERLPITSPCPKLDPDGEERWGVRQRAELRHARIARMAKEGRPPRVFMLGDSITEWFAPKPWARLARFAPANVGVSGDVIENVLWRIDLGMFDVVKPEALVLLIGTNNGGNTPAERAQGVAAIVDKIREKSPKTKILLYGIFPRGKTWPAEKNPLKDTNALLAKLAAEKGVAYADVTASFLAADGVTVRQELFRDGLHPNEAGDDVWVDSLERELGKLLGEPRADALPSVPFIRGVKAMLPGRDAFGDYRALVDLMAHFGLNTLMLELGGAMEYKSHPEVNEGWIEYAKIMNEYPGKTLKIQHAQKWHKNSIHSENGGGGVLTQKEIAELAAYARERGIEIIPEVPCLSHSDYLLWRHRELAERQNDPHPDCYCPSDPRSYALLFDLLDEVVALFKPRIVNVGHDEWYSIGVCDRCRGKNAAELYAGDVRKIRDHLAAKGVRTMMWAEKLLDFKFCDSKKPWAGAATEDFPATHPAIDMLPKDVVMLHWYWSLGRTLENAFADRGFTWVFGNYSARGMLDYPGRSRKRGFSGYMLSNWGRSDIPTLQRNGVLADIVMDKLVEESKDPDAEIDALWERMFKELFALRHPADRTYYRLRHHATRKREFRCFFDGFYVKKEDWLLGRYVLTLADGGKVTHDVLYGENVTHADVDWNPPREWDTDARRGRGELAAVAYSTLPVRQGGRTTYEIAIEIPKGAQVVSCVFEPAEGQPKDAVAFEPVTPPAPPSATVDRKALVDFLSLPSRSHDLPQLKRGIDFLKDWLTARGVWCTVETNECGYVGLYAATTPGKVHDYMFVGHLDVVDAPDEMFKPRIEGDRVFARGACDTKGNVLVMCQVLANLVGKASVGMFVATDEEGGGAGAATPQMMIDRGYLPRKLILVGDTAGEEPNQLFIAEKGHCLVELVAHGKGGHSSRPWALDNPIPKLCEGYLKFKEAWDRGADPNEHWRTVLSPTIVHASDVGNVVSDSASMRFSCRYTSDAELERAVKTMKETTGLEVRVAASRRPPVVNRPGDPEMVALWWEMNDRLPGGVRQGRMSAATDASYFAGHGVPIVIFTAEGGEPHSAREWGSLKSLDEHVALFTRYFAENEASGVNEIAYHPLAGTPKPFYYAARHPIEKGSACEVAVVQVHGWGDGVWTPLEMISLMKALRRATPEGEEPPYVVDPFFPRRQVLAERNLPDDGRAIWNDSWTESCVTMGSAGDDWRGGGDAVGTTFSSFDAMDMILEKLGDRKLFPNLRRVVVTGFSAGGQFVGRYVAVGKGKVRDGVTVEYAAMAPSTEFRPEPDVPWLYGLKGRPRYSANLAEAQIRANLLSRHVRRACGTLDNQVGAQYAVDGTPPALAQGRSRYERFVNFRKYLDEGHPNWRKQVTFHPMEGVGHDSSVAHRLPGFIDYVFGKSE